MLSNKIKIYIHQYLIIETENQFSEEEELQLNHNKIFCNTSNSFAIAQSGDLYVWGKQHNGVMGILTTSQKKETPARLLLEKKYPLYKCVHVSAGLTHIAAIMRCELQKYVKDEGQNSLQTTKIFELQFKVLNQKKVNVLEYFNFHRYVHYKEFLEFEKDCLRSIKYTQAQQISMKQYYDIIKHSIENNVAGSEPKWIDIFKYFFNLTKGRRSKYILLMWGNSGHGKLGLSNQVIEQNTIYRQKLQQASDSSSNEDEEEDSEEKNDASKSNKNDGKSSDKQHNQSNSKVSQSQSGKSKQQARLKHQNAVVRVSELKMDNVVFVKVSCGHNHTIAIDINYRLYVWGMGSQGCLGKTNISDITQPTILEVDEDDKHVLDIACGAYFCLTLTKEHNVYSWGVNYRGQLGLGIRDMKLQPTKIEYFSRKKISPVMLAAGDQHAACITDGHELFTWGNGDYYRLGHGVCMDQLEPKLVEVLQDVYVMHVSCGTNHTLSITNEGFVYSWGSGMQGKLGLGSLRDAVLPTRVGLDTKNFKNYSYFQVAAGTFHSMALTNDGLLFTWGSTKNGVLGVKIGQKAQYSPPIKVIEGQDIENMETFRTKYFNYTKLTNENGNTEINHQELLPIQLAQTQPTVIEEGRLHEGSFRFAAAGDQNTFFINHEGYLYGCGSLTDGMLGINPNQSLPHNQSLPDNFNNQNTDILETLKKSAFQPFKLTYFSKTIIHYVSCSQSHAIAITSRGAGYCWGANLHFQLGLGFASDFLSTPVRLSGALEQKQLVMSVCGEKYSAVLTRQGEVWSFGTSEVGVCGQESKNYYVIQVPRMINDIPSMIYIACGGQSMFAIEDKAFRLWGWGSNQYGQLGISLSRNNQQEEKNHDNNERVGKQFEEDENKEKFKLQQQKLRSKLEKLKNPENYIIYLPHEIEVRANNEEITVIQVACGVYHSLILTKTNVVMSCGLIKYSGQTLHQINDEDNDSEQEKTDLKSYTDRFSFISGFETKRLKMIACNEYTSLVLASDNQIYQWGKLIRNDKEIFGMQPILIDFPMEQGQQLIYVTAGTNHVVCLDDKFKAYSWGNLLGGRTGVSLKRLWPSFTQQTQYLNICTGKMQEILTYKAENQTVSAKSSKRGTSKIDGGKSKIQDEKEEEKNQADEEEDILQEMSLKSGDSIDGSVSSESELFVNNVPPPNQQTEEDHNKSINSYKVSQTGADGPKVSFAKSLILKVQEKNSKVSVKMSKLSKNSLAKKKQDQLQKFLQTQPEECEPENLYIGDKEIDNKLILFIQDSAADAVQLMKQLSGIKSQISGIIDHRTLNIGNLYNSQQQTIAPFSVPNFIIKNIQLYEMIFSLYYYHPCYFLRIIQNGSVSKQGLSRLLEIIYRNPLSKSNQVSHLMTLTIKTFEYELMLAQDKIEFISSPKTFKNSTYFYLTYLQYLQCCEKENLYFTKFAKYIISDLFLAKNIIYVTSLKRDEQEIKMINFLNLNFNTGDLSELDRKLDCLCYITVETIRRMIKEKQMADQSNQPLITESTQFLHNQLIDFISQTLLKTELQRLEEQYNVDIPRQRNIVQEKLRQYENHLKNKIENFILNLYYSSLTEFIQREQTQQHEYPREMRGFFKGDNNFRAIGNMIDRFFQRDTFSVTSENYSQINKLISDRILVDGKQFEDVSIQSKSDEESANSHKNKQNENPKQIQTKTDEQNLNAISKNSQMLYGKAIVYGVEILCLKEFTMNSFSDADEYLSVQVEDILTLQNIYCENMQDPELRRRKTQKLYLRGREDPLYIVFKEMKFKDFPINSFSNEIRKRRMNLKLIPNPLIYAAQKAKCPEEVFLYKCEVCKILLGKDLMSIEREKTIDDFVQNGWVCAKNHQNKKDILDCDSQGCSEFISKHALEITRILKYFYLKKNEQTLILSYVLTHISPIQHDENIYQLFQDLLQTHAVKKNIKLTNMMERLIMLLSGFKEENSNDQTKEKDAMLKSNIIQNEEEFMSNYNVVYSQAVTELKERSAHRNQQIAFHEFIKHLYLIKNEKTSELRAKIQLLYESESFLRNKMTIYKSESEALQIQNQIDHEVDVVEDKTQLEKLAFGFKTSLYLFKEGVLIRIQYQGRPIERITRSLRFYFYQNKGGGWVISAVFQQENILNNFVSCLKFVWPIELEILTITIPVEQYSELKRLKYFRSQISFQNDSIQITFDIRQLMNLFKELEERVI